MNAKTSFSCMDDFDPESITPDQAAEHIQSVVQPITETETVLTMEALDRVLAVEVRSEIDVPGHTNSAMDGYAVRGQDLPAQEPKTFTLIGSSFAGHPHDGSVGSGECVRIMTGGVMPDAADTVVIQERVQAASDTEIEISSGEKPGQNVRAAGEDIAAGSVILEPGHLLGPADLGLLASVGIAKVPVRRRIRVAFFSTGDELREVGEPLEDGQIYNSNRYTLSAMLRHLHVDALDLGVVRDDPAAVAQAFHDASEQADMVITSGGVSVGEADYVKEVLGELGDVNFWKVAIKPGRPLAFGRIGAAKFFGLPGNPVSVMVTFYQFVRPALLRMAGATEQPPLALRVPVTSSLRKRQGRVEYQRGILQRAEDGSHTVSCTGAQGSGILTSMSQANCFIVLPLEQGRVEEGAIVEVIPFSGIT